MTYVTSTVASDPHSWTVDELGKRTSIERFFGRVLVFFRLQRPSVFGWLAGRAWR